VSPLHVRLTVVVASVLITALGLSSVATYVAFSIHLGERLDAALRDTPIVFADHPPGADGPERGPDPGPGPRVAPYVHIIDPDGSVRLDQAGRDAAGHAFTAELPAVLPEVARSDVSGGPAAFFDARSAESAGPRLRVKVSVDSTGEVLVLALPRTENESLLRRLAWVEACVATAALLLAAATSFWGLRRRLAPLRRLAGAVESLGADDLTARVQVPVDRTSREVNELATVTNALLRRVHDAFTKEQDTQERLRRFVADASHELRTPIAAVSAYAQLFDLGARDRPEDLARSMAGIRREAARMRDLAEDLLILTTAEQAPAPGHRAADLAEVVGQAVEAALAVDPGRPVTISLGPGVGSVAADPAQLRRVLDNLLANVRTHTPPSTAAHIEARRDGAEVVLAVADDGPGLTAEERAQMFDRFWRPDRSRSRAAGGSGLGLSIVATIVTGGGGRVAAAETPGGGLTVTLTLPAAAV